MLNITNLTKRFGGLRAVDDVSFQVNAGEILGLLGPNGAGKTTLLNLIAGALSCTSGNIIYEGNNTKGLSTHVLATRGIVRTFQLTVLMKDFTVTDNILVSTYLRAKPRLWSTLVRNSYCREQQETGLQKALEVLEFTGLESVKDELAGNLPHGYQRILGVAIALTASPKLLLLDEPMSGMNLEEIQAMMKLIKSIQKEGITVLLVEHHVEAVMGICDRLVVLNFGKKIAEGLPEEISSNKQVIEAYLGTKYENRRSAKSR